jgi:hypothetical protein
MDRCVDDWLPRCSDCHIGNCFTSLLLPNLVFDPSLVLVSPEMPQEIGSSSQLTCYYNLCEAIKRERAVVIALEW